MTQPFDDQPNSQRSAEDAVADGSRGDQSQQASRRRFVKHLGLAAPAIMTLRGGQAWAQATSSFTLSACIAERSEMGQVAQNAMGDELYFVVDVHADGISVSPANKDDPGAQTVTASCMASLI